MINGIITISQKMTICTVLKNSQHVAVLLCVAQNGAPKRYFAIIIIIHAIDSLVYPRVVSILNF